MSQALQTQSQIPKLAETRLILQLEFIVKMIVSVRSQTNSLFSFSDLCVKV